MNMATRQSIMLDFLSYIVATEGREIREIQLDNGCKYSEYIFVRFIDDFEAYIEALESYDKDVQYVRLNHDIYGKIAGQWKKLCLWHM